MQDNEVGIFGGPEMDLLGDDELEDNPKKIDGLEVDEEDEEDKEENESDEEETE
jgi:hypothetical protein